MFRTSSSWRERALDIASGFRSHSLVEPSTSVNRNVTVPVGMSVIGWKIIVHPARLPTRRVAVDLESRQEQQKRETEQGQHLQRQIHLYQPKDGGADHDTGYDLKYHGGQMQCRCEAEQERHCEGYRCYDQYTRKRDVGHHKNRLVCVVGSFASMRLATLPERPIEVEGGAD